MIESKREIIEHPEPLKVGFVEQGDEVNEAWLGYDPQNWVMGVADTRYYEDGREGNALDKNFFGGTYLLTTSPGETKKILQRITKARDNCVPVILRYLDADTRETCEALVLAIAPFDELTDGNGLTVWLRVLSGYQREDGRLPPTAA